MGRGRVYADHTQSGTYSVKGTLTITPSCGGAVASSLAQQSPAAASSCGLAITSPPDKSIIAITDPHYVDGAEIGPDNRAPKLDELKLKVTGTSTSRGPVTVNGVSATLTGDDWTAKIPLMALAVGGVGQVTLTAKAGDCSDASSTVTLINLEITNPTENKREAITIEPAMPVLNATVRVYGYPGDTSGVRFEWKLEARGETVHREGTPGHWVGKWEVYSQTIATGSTTGTGEAWKPSYDQIVGGVGRLTVRSAGIQLMRAARSEHRLDPGEVIQDHRSFHWSLPVLVRRSARDPVKDHVSRGAEQDDRVETAVELRLVPHAPLNEEGATIIGVQQPVILSSPHSHSPRCTSSENSTYSRYSRQPGSSVSTTR